jgi:TPR repeat protein
MRLRKNCSSCGSRNVRRLSSHDRFRALYACRNCGESFWVARRTLFYIAAGFGVVVVLAGFPWVIASLASYFERERELARATHALEETAKRAQAKDPVAEYDLARRYATGMGVRLDIREAAIWLERAAEHAHTRAQLELGMASLKGEGALQDFAAALKWLSRAAEGGNAEAQYHLGLMYKNGTGVAPDDFKSYTWLSLAAAQGIETAIAPRDAAMRRLSPDQVMEAQAEARRMRNTVGHASTKTSAERHLEK